MRRKYIIGLWTLIALAAAACCMIVTMIWNGWIGYMPPIEDLQNPIDKYATQVLSSDGKVIGININGRRIFDELGIPSSDLYLTKRTLPADYSKKELKVKEFNNAEAVAEYILR